MDLFFHVLAAITTSIGQIDLHDAISMHYDR